MAFSEPVFLFLFLPLLLLFYPLLPIRVRNAALAFASILFYAWDEPANTLLLLASIGINYGFGLSLNRYGGRWMHPPLLWLGVGANLCLLGWFKYAGWLLSELNPWLAHFGLRTIVSPNPELPIGISFFTFQAISYLFDVSRGTCEVQRRLTDLALYISLFPQLVAGPIVRYSQIARQLTERTLSRRKTVLGIRRFVIGLGKKVIVADTLAIPADAIFALPVEDLTIPVAWLGVTCYAFQIYFDFSGYSDMAIGLGRMFGFKIPENFRYPYLARSITDFWRRWHLTLSRWFRDYLYIPLGGNRSSGNRTYFNLTVVFLLCGLWHGANWTFILWGIFHGALLVLERIFKGICVPVVFGRILTIALVLIGWVLFRSQNVSDAIAYVLAMFGVGFGSHNYVETADYLTPEVAVVWLLAAIGSGALLPWIRSRACAIVISRPERSTRINRLKHWHASADLTCICLFVVSCFRIAASTYVPFLYFRF